MTDTAQEDEINAIKSIYEEDDLFMFDKEKKCGSFRIKFSSENLNFTPFNVNIGEFSSLNQIDSNSFYCIISFEIK